MSGKKRVFVLSSSSPDNNEFILNSDDDDNIPIASVINNSNSKRSSAKKSAEKPVSKIKNLAEKKTRQNSESGTAQGEGSTPRKKYSFRKRDPQKLQYYTNTTWVNPSTIPDDPRLDLDILLEPVEGFDFEAKTKLKHKDQRDDDFVPPALPTSPNSRPRKYRRLFKRSHLSPPPTTPQAKQKRTWGKNPTRLRLSTLNSEKSILKSQAREFDYDLPSPTLPSVEELLRLSNTPRDVTRTIKTKHSSTQYTIPRSPPLPSTRPLLYSPPNTFDNPSEFTFSDSELDYRLPSFALPPPKKSQTKTRSRHLNFFKFYESQLPELYYVPQWLRLIKRTYKTRERLNLTISDSPWDKIVIEETGKTNESHLIRFRHHFGPRQFPNGLRLNRFKMPKLRDSRITPDNRGNRNNSSNKGVGSGSGRNRFVLSNRQTISDSPSYLAKSRFKVVPPKISIQTSMYKPPVVSKSNADSLNIKKFRISDKLKPIGSTSNNIATKLYSDPVTSELESAISSITANSISNNQYTLEVNSPNISNIQQHSINLKHIPAENSETVTVASSSANIVVNHIKPSNGLRPRKNLNISDDTEMGNASSPKNFMANDSFMREDDTNKGGEDILARLGFTTSNTSTNVDTDTKHLRSSLANRDISSGSNVALFKNLNSAHTNDNSLRYNSNMSTHSNDAAYSSNPIFHKPFHLSTRNDNLFTPKIASISPSTNHKNQTFSDPSNLAEFDNVEIKLVPEKSLIERKSWLNKFSQKLWKIHHPEQPKLPKLKHVEATVIEPTKNAQNFEGSTVRKDNIFNFDLEFESDNDEEAEEIIDEVILPRDGITGGDGFQFEYSKPVKSSGTNLLVEPLEISSDNEPNSDNDNDADHWTNDTSTQSRSRLSRSLVLRSSSNSPPQSSIKDFDLSRELYSDHVEAEPRVIDLNNFNFDELDNLGDDEFELMSETWADNNDEDNELDYIIHGNSNDFCEDEFNMIHSNINDNESICFMGTDYKLKIPKHIANLIDLATSTIIQAIFKINQNSGINPANVKFVFDYLNLIERDKLEGYFRDKKGSVLESFESLLNNLNTLLNNLINRNTSNRTSYLTFVFDLYIKILQIVKNFNSSDYSTKLKDFSKFLLKFELNEILQSWEIRELQSRNSILERVWIKLSKLYNSNDNNSWLTNSWYLYCEFIEDCYDEVSGKLKTIMEYGSSTSNRLPSWANTHWSREYGMTILERSLLPFSESSNINEMEGIDHWLQFCIGAKSANTKLTDKLSAKVKDLVKIGDNINYFVHWQDRIEVFINQLGWKPSEPFLISLFQFYKERNYTQLTSHYETSSFQYIKEFDTCASFLSTQSSDYFTLLSWYKAYLTKNVNSITNRSLLIFLSKVFPTQPLKLKSTYPSSNYQSFINRVSLLVTLALTCSTVLINLGTLLKRLKVVIVPEWEAFDAKTLYIIGISYIDLIGVRITKFSDEHIELDSFRYIQKVISQLHLNQTNLDNSSGSSINNSSLLEQKPLTELPENFQILIKLYSKLSQLVSSLNTCTQPGNSDQCKLSIFTQFLNSIKVRNMISPLTRLPHQLRFFYLSLFKNLLQKLDTSSDSGSNPQCTHHSQAKALILNFIREDNWRNQLRFLKTHLELDLGEEAEDESDSVDDDGKINLGEFNKVIGYFLELLNE